MVEIVMNPVRQRIFQYFLLHETGTVKELRNALPDVPSASLYRHVKILTDCSVLTVVGENRIRGTVESIYQLNKAALTIEDETGNTVQMSLLRICAAFARYFSGGNADPKKGYAALYKLYAGIDGRGIFGLSFGGQWGRTQIYEGGSHPRQQSTADHTDLRPDGWAGGISEQ